MSCDHCVFGCAKETKGVDMTETVYKQALSITGKLNTLLSIGGGEPTIHPKFWEFWGLAIGSGADHIWMATNGKNRKTTEKLIAAHHAERFTLVISQDPWHEPIHSSIPITAKNNGVELRCNGYVTRNGSAEKNNIYTQDDCRCANIFVDVKGDCHPCACNDSPVLFTTNTTPDKHTLEYIHNIIITNGCWRTWDDGTLNSITEKIIRN